jgi:hypothetical protein
MIKYLTTALLLISLTNVSGQSYNEKYGEPVVTLIETNPWLMIIGSDVASFALYENGQIIYRKIVNKRYKYFEVKKDQKETQRIIKSLGITDSLMRAPDYVPASNSTDEPTNIMLLNFDTLRQISVYGNLRTRESEARTRTPGYFLTVYDNIIKFDDNAAVEWLPDTIEVMATKYSYSPEQPIKWNSTWGDIESPTTVKRSEDLYSIYLDRKYFNDFLKLLATLKEKQAVMINGEKYSLTYRLPFPNLR